MTYYITSASSNTSTAVSDESLYNFVKKGCSCYHIREPWLDSTTSATNMSEGAYQLYTQWASTASDAGSNLWEYCTGVGAPFEHYIELVDNLPYEYMCQGDRIQHDELMHEEMVFRELMRHKVKGDFVLDMAQGMIDQKARDLLKSVLSPAEWEAFQKEHHVDIENEENIIRVNDIAQIEVLDKKTKMLLHKLCVITPKHLLPMDDQVAAKVVMARCAPQKLMEVGCKY